MDRLTFLNNGSPAYKLKGCVCKNEIARKLYAYEDTGLAPAEIEQLKADNARLHALVDNIECVMRGER